MNLATECLAIPPLDYSTVNLAFQRGEISAAETRRLCLSHERLRADTVQLREECSREYLRGRDAQIAATTVADLSWKPSCEELQKRLDAVTERLRELKRMCDNARPGTFWSCDVDMVVVAALAAADGEATDA